MLIPKCGTHSSVAWPDLNRTILTPTRREPPPLPLRLFGPFWGPWIAETAAAAAAPPDYVAAALLVAVSVLVGHARWAQATPGWSEPPHLWLCAVGHSGAGKSPGRDVVLRDVLPEIERRMVGDFPERLREWTAQAQHARARRRIYQDDVHRALAKGDFPPPAPEGGVPAQPQAPRLLQNDVTIEKVAALLAINPKGLLIERDEIAGWLGRNGAVTRSFWLEAYGGRSYRVERQYAGHPIDIPRLAVAVHGGTQPQRLATLLRTVDDGMLGRICWVWPNPVPFRLGQETPQVGPPIEALDRLRLLELGTTQGGAAEPVCVRLVPSALPTLEQFGQRMQAEQEAAGPIVAATFGKARGLALRLSLVLAMLRWCDSDSMEPPPTEIAADALEDAIGLVEAYFLPMACRVFGVSATSQVEQSAAVLGRWILRTGATEVHIRSLQRAELAGLRTAEEIRAGANLLVGAGWLRPPSISGAQVVGRPRQAYPVNPCVFNDQD
jgi:hypothetical protein